MTEIVFSGLVKKTILDYWNTTPTLVKKFGEITARKPKIVSIGSVRGRCKALAKVHFDNGDYYFEVSWTGPKTNRIEFDVYKRNSKTHSVQLD